MKIIYRNTLQIEFSHKNRNFHGFIGGCGEAFHIVNAESREVITSIPTDIEANGFGIHDDYLVIAEMALDSISLIEGWLTKIQEPDEIEIENLCVA